MFRELITLLAFAIFFVVLHVLVLENKDRVERDGHGIPIIGVFLAWIAPVLDEIYEATVGKRLRGQKDQKKTVKTSKRTHSVQKEETHENEPVKHEEVQTAAPITASQSKRRDSTMTAQSEDNATEHSKQGKHKKKKRRSSKRRKSTLGATSEDGGTSVDESHNKKKKKKKSRRSKKTKNTSVDENGKSVDESVDKQKKPVVSPRNSKQKRQSKLQEPSSDDGGGHSSENSTGKKRKIKKEAPTSTRYSRMLQKKMGNEPSSEEDNHKPPAKNSIDQKTDEQPLVSLPKRALHKLRDSFKIVKRSKK